MSPEKKHIDERCDPITDFRNSFISSKYFELRRRQMPGFDIKLLKATVISNKAGTPRRGSRGGARVSALVIIVCSTLSMMYPKKILDIRK